MPNSNPSSFTFTGAPIVDKSGNASFQFIKTLTDWNTRITNSLNQLGQLIGEISAQAVISGRTEGIGTTVQNLNSEGVITPPGLIAATSGAQGAVILPSGAGSNILGSASLEAASAFDAGGSAATAQANAETYADGVAATAQANAQAYASNASNLTSGSVAFARLPGISGSVTLAQLTTGGTQGSIAYTNGLITAVVNPT